MDKYDVGMESEDYNDEETAAKSVLFASLDLSSMGQDLHANSDALVMHLYSAGKKAWVARGQQRF